MNTHSEHDQLWPVISTLIGWTYFLAWSCSFYPQAILNFKRKSVQGLSMDFLFLNVFGFFCYSIFNLSFFFSKEIQDEYKERNNSKENLVRANDVVFAVHAFLISSFTLIQTFYYKRDHKQQVSRFARYFIIGATIGSLGVISVVYTGHAMLIDLMYYLSYVKMLISLIKYVPQVWINFQRQSTVGWSIYNILLDCTGGVLSISQLLLDAALSGDWSGVYGNPVKLGLGLQSIGFDIIFMLQHYVLYRDRTDIYLNTLEEERRRLIVEGRVPRPEVEEDEESSHHYL